MFVGMNRAVLSLILIIFLGACNENLQSGPPKKPGLRPGHAMVTIKKGDLFSVSTRYDNLSATEFFRCHKDHGSQYYIEARQSKGSDEDWFSLFFPITADTASGVEAEWTGNAVELYGKITPFKRLGGSLTGSCAASLNLVGNKLTGNIACKDFENTDPGGIGKFDLEVSGLSCVID